MKRPCAQVSFLALLFLCQPAMAAATATPTAEKTLALGGAFSLTLKQSEKLAFTAEEIQQARARFYRAFDYFLPTVDFEMTRFDQDATGNSSSSSTTNATRHSTPENKFTFSQPLFSGFKEFAAMRASAADTKEREKLYRRAQELLFLDVMDAYYNALQAKKEVAILEEQRNILRDRLKELDGRMRVGRSRESEAQSSTSDLKVVEADLVVAGSEAEQAQNLLEFYMGEPIGGRALAEEETPGELLDLSAYLPHASKRSDVDAAREDYLLSESRLVAAQGDLFPTVSAEGNYYTRRVGFQDGNDWDVTLKMTVPVFEFGRTAGDIKEAAATRQQARLKLREAERLAALDIRDTYEIVTSARKAEKALGEAKEASKKDYDLQMQDYRQNLVNNLDVLDSLRRYLDVSRRYNQASYAARKNYWKLKIALGELPQERTS